MIAQPSDLSEELIPCWVLRSYQTAHVLRVLINRESYKLLDIGLLFVLVWYYKWI